jgi:catechol 2,3-dioxygenase-like lactoylglutathione lyase family enzyme
MAETQAAEPGQGQASTVLPFGTVAPGRPDATEPALDLTESQPAPPLESQPAASRPPETQSAETQSAETQSAETQPVGAPTPGESEPDASEAVEAAQEESPGAWPAAQAPVTGDIHHVELWVPNLDRAILSWGWLLTALGYRMFQDWPGGRSWRSGSAYIVVEQSPARTASRHDRCRPGLNHLAFHVETRQQVDELTGEALLHGWKLMFTDLHPFAGGPQHYAAYLENADGFEAELVAG